MLSIGSAASAWRLAYKPTEGADRSKFSNAGDSTEKHSSETYHQLPVAPDNEHGSVNIEA